MLKYKPEYVGELNHTMKVLYILYYVPSIERDNIKKINLYIDDQLVPVNSLNKELFQRCYSDGTDCPFKGSREVTIELVAETETIQKKYPVSFQENLEWKNF
jgi:hypothetical protein